MKKLLFILILPPFISYGQNGYSGDDHKYVKVIQENNKITSMADETITVSGNVLLEIDETKINCDSAVIDNKNFTLSAYGHVIISTSADLQFHSSNINLDLVNRRIVFYEKNSSEFITTPTPFNRIKQE